MVEVADPLDQATGDELIDDFLAEAVDIHGAACCEVEDPTPHLLRATHGVWALHDLLCTVLVRLENQSGATLGACIGEFRERAVGMGLIEDHALHLWNDVPTPNHDHGVTNSYIELRQVVLIVKARAADRNSADPHRLEVRHWGDGTSATHLIADRLEDGGHLRWRILQGGRPSWGARHEAERLLLVNAVHLDHCAIDLVGK